MNLNLDELAGKIVCIYGPTASEKSDFSIEIARKTQGVIINADSMQIYNGLPILTAQPLAEYMNQVEHSLYSIIEINSVFSVYEWLELCVKEIREAQESEKTPIVVGGTGLYFYSLMNGIAKIPEISVKTKEKVSGLIDNLTSIEMYELLKRYDLNLSKKLNANDKFRITRGLEVFFETGESILKWHEDKNSSFEMKDFFNLYMFPKRDFLYQKIEKRFFKMIDLGVIEEVEKVIKAHKIDSIPKIIGFKEIVEYIEGRINFNDMKDQVLQSTRNYAKRQYTWFNNKFEHSCIISR